MDRVIEPTETEGRTITRWTGEVNVVIAAQGASLGSTRRGKMGGTRRRRGTTIIAGEVQAKAEMIMDGPLGLKEDSVGQDGNKGGNTYRQPLHSTGQ